MPAAVNLREDGSAGELRALARRAKDRLEAGENGASELTIARSRGDARQKSAPSLSK